MYRFVFSVLVGLSIVFNLHAQDEDKSSVTDNDSISSEEIILSPVLASKYIVDLLNTELLWKPESDSIKLLLRRLVNQYNETYDSVETKLSEMNLPVKFRKVDTLQHDTLNLRWLNKSTFIIDTVELERDPIFVQKTIVKRIVDSLIILNDTTLSSGYVNDTTIRRRDTITSAEETFYEKIIDTAFLETKNIRLYQIENRRIVPDLFPAGSSSKYHFLNDGSKLVVSEPLRVMVADQKSPFNIVPNQKIPDSLRVAVQTLLSYTDQRDSIQLFLNNIDGASTPFWLTNREDELRRYWIKNQKEDSVSVWMGNPDKRNISLVLEDDINVERIRKETIDYVPITMAVPEFNLVKVEPLKEIPVLWDFDFSSSFSLSQNYLSNWAKGGENSLSSLLDVNGQAKYTNKAAKTSWTSSARLKYGSVLSEENGLRKNTDILELNSKYNKTIRKKTAFSALYYMKNQIAEGFNYPNDSVVVSKFLNPITFTIGLGLEYTPIKKSTINFSILSYKNTFVLDTANIDQTNHGIDEDKRAKHEMGGQVLIKNEFTVWDDMKIKNSMRFFSNYLEKPQNIDVEWEVDLEKQISLYFTVQLNLHLIYDDDIRFTKYVNDKPVLDADQNEVKIPMLQFKEFLGLTFLIKI